MTNAPTRAILYAWAAPATLVGLLATALALCCGARARVVNGVIEVSGGKLGLAVAWLPLACQFDAITLGHVVLAKDALSLVALRRHEHAHVRQYEIWGMLFFPAYLLSSAWQWIQGRHPYRHNWFELDATRAERD